MTIFTKGLRAPEDGRQPEELAGRPGEGADWQHGYVRDRMSPQFFSLFMEEVRRTEVRGFGAKLSVEDLGGKNIGLLLLEEYLLKDGGPGQFDRATANIPNTKMFAAPFFHTFIRSNPKLVEVLLEKDRKIGYDQSDYRDIHSSILKGTVPKEILYELIVLLQKAPKPFYIVRSSATCEDGQFPSAGLFESRFFYNDLTVPAERRARDLAREFKLVWSSLFVPPAINMMKKYGLDPLSQAMCITFQPVVGRWYGRHFFPLMSGVFKSVNTWPWGPEIRRADPVGRFGFGLGTFMVGDTGCFKEGGPRVASISPAGDMMQFLGAYVDPETMLGLGGTPHSRTDLPDEGQRFLEALRVDEVTRNGRTRKVAVVERLPLFFNTRRPDHPEGIAAHIPYQWLRLLGSYRFGVDHVTGRSHSEATFNAIQMESEIRKGHFFELWALLRKIMDDLREKTGENISFEWALDADPGKGDNSFVFYLLQVRPQTAHRSDARVELSDLRGRERLCLASSTNSFGHEESTVPRAFVLTSRIVGRLGKRVVKRLLREVDARYLNRYLLVGPDAESFVAGTDAFESIYGGLLPQVVISIKTPDEIRNLVGDSGSHTADNIERTPIIIQEAASLLPGLRQLLAEVERDVLTLDPKQVTVEHLLVERPLRVELDGNSGRGQIFFAGEPGTDF